MIIRSKINGQQSEITAEPSPSWGKFSWAQQIRRRVVRSSVLSVSSVRWWAQGQSRWVLQWLRGHSHHARRTPLALAGFPGTSQRSSQEGSRPCDPWSQNLTVWGKKTWERRRQQIQCIAISSDCSPSPGCRMLQRRSGVCSVIQSYSESRNTEANTIVLRGRKIIEIPNPEGWSMKHQIKDSP